MASDSGEPNLGPALFSAGLVGGFIGAVILAFLALIWAIDVNYVNWPPTARDSGANQAVVGEGLATSTGCLGCHSIDGAARTGPTWQGLAGSERELRSGGTTTATTEYLRKSIVDPSVEVVAGYLPAIMPTNYATSLTPSEIDAVVAYIESLVEEP